ncbi:DNA-directed RNA polymerase I subunit RPA2 [Periplaneta americana]|uniref:DNA-directed RNA polymerase I subunit RPA2 n=1 Tax=Periplaneta americana TaxID=6978 RepID=UPI0037E98AB5
MADIVRNLLDVDPTLKNLTSGFGHIPGQQNDLLQSLGSPHVKSFNFMIRDGLHKAVEDIVPVEFLIKDDRIRLQFKSAEILPPLVQAGTIGAKIPTVFPTECRQRGSTYRGLLKCVISCEVNDIEIASQEKDLGQIPIMVKSDLCHLTKLNPEQLISKGEHAEEWGGYFIIKGHERLVRMLQMARRNYPLTLRRTAWKKRGNLFSDLAVTIRCIKDDQTSTNNVLHFVKNGSAKLMFSHRRFLYYAPIMLVLKCLKDVSDEFIIRQFMNGYEDDTYFRGCLMNMLQELHEEGIHTHVDARTFVGKAFRSKIVDLPPWKSDEEICDFLIKHCFAIHLDNNEDKFNLYVMMMQKLFCSVHNKTSVESGDGLMMHELLLGGHFYLQYLKEKLSSWLVGVKLFILKKANSTASFSCTPSEFSWALARSGTVEAPMERFLATGNISSRSGLGLLQDKGLTVVAENINRMRYMSHFRSVHRGAFFQEMRSTEPRQLLPEAWGFICPVHTPDGAPCGLLNHLTKYCEVTDVPDPELVKNIPSVLVSFGMIPLAGITTIPLNHSKHYIVLLDGRVLGHVEESEAPRLVDKLRLLKISGKKVPHTLEIALVPMRRKGGQFPGLFLFTTPARMMRPVINLSAQKVELIGTFEQVYLDICIYPEEAHKGLTTHQEITDTSFLSNLACLIPLPDSNQSPRNMYQCQMGKQTMGTPCHTWHLQADTKLYRLQTPASPLFRPGHYDLVGIDEFAMGTNAIVAVIAYTGYDMEDAMIINKGAYERGFGHGSLYKSDFIELKSPKSYFELDPDKTDLEAFLDSDGLPHPGTYMKQGQPYCCYYDGDQARYRIEKWKSNESAYVDNVRLCGVLSNEKRKACIVFRIPRNPSVGDKFASRAGQKGICSYLWPAEDLPYTETGLIPDIVFNPHGFPSRMTVAMMIEVMAGKSAALHGLVHDATPFKFSERDTAIDYFSKMLEAGGYNYHGTERMYSGIDGREIKADIFFGVVHYQRLRHMVSDKWQVRSTGPIDVLTHQPVKGRRRGGGVRFGEMERDSLLSHGGSFLLQDRLLRCSDKTTMLICRTCGSILSPIQIAKRRGGHYEYLIKCQVCEEKGKVEEIELPYIFRFLVAELASAGIKIKIDVTEK